MIVYWSMVLWTPIVYFFYFATKRENRIEQINREKKYSNPYKLSLFWALLLFGFFFFWMVIRKRTGDTVNYIGIYNNLTTDFGEGLSNIDWSGKETKGPLFQFYMLFVKCFISPNDTTFWIASITTFSILPLFIQLREYSVDFFTTSYMFITMQTFFWLMNGVRQALCVCILFGCINWIKDGKWIKFFIVVWIMSLVHQTCLILIPLYFVARFKPWRIKTAVFIFCIILIGLFSDSIFGGVDNMLADTAYSGATSQFAEDDGVNPIRVLFYFLPVLLAYNRRNELEEYYNDYPILPICINMSIVAFGLYFIGMFTSGILIGRLPIYAEVYNLLLFPYLFRFCFKNQPYIKAGIYILFLAYFYLTFQNVVYDSELTGWLV